MEGIGTAELILPGTASPHNASLKPSQRRLIDTADIIFHIGGGLEGSLDKPLAQRRADGARVIALIDAPGLNLLPARAGGLWHSDDAGHSGDHDAHGATDPHVWLDPLNAIVMARIMADALANADSQNARRYRTNADKFADQVTDVHARIAARLAPVHDKPFVVFHDAYQYFETRFALAAAGAITIDPERRPGARRLRDMRRAIAERGALCVFAEPQFDVAYVNTVIEGTGARAAVLDPIGSGTYPQLIEGMAAAIAGCLSGAP